MPEDNRVAEVLEDWYELREQGLDCDPKAVVEAHPELADVLVRHFAALEAFDRMAGARGAAGTPQALGEFRILREMGRGGMGVVYEAEQASMRRSVALKVLYPGVTSSLRAVRRFQREAQAAGRLHHTHIVPVYGMGEDGGVWYYAMELVRGRPLHQVLEDQRRLRGDDAPPSGLGGQPGTRKHYEHLAGMFAGVAEGLQAAHEAGVIHRDVKPSNLLLDEGGTLRLTDFGLARVEGESVTATVAGAVLGTPAYMSPEQAAGDGSPLDARTDVYGLGVTLYEVLTLRTPFRGRSAVEIYAQIANRDPVPPRRADPRIPRDLEAVVLKCMEKERSRRYSTAGELAGDLRAFEEGRQVRAKPVGPLGRAWRSARRHRLLTALVATLTLLSAGVAVLALLQVRGTAARESRQRAESHLQHASNLWESGRLEEAIEVYRQAVECDPGWGKPHANLGSRLHELHHNEEALLELERACIADPSSGWAPTRKGEVLLVVGRTDEAALAFAAALRLEPDNARAHQDRIRTLLTLKRYEGALLACEEATRKFPDLLDLRAFKAASLLGTGKVAAARAYAEGAAMGAPRYDEDPLSRAYLLAAAGRKMEAEKLLQDRNLAVDQVWGIHRGEVQAVIGDADQAAR